MTVYGRSSAVSVWDAGGIVLRVDNEQCTHNVEPQMRDISYRYRIKYRIKFAESGIDTALHFLRSCVNEL